MKTLHDAWNKVLISVNRYRSKNEDYIFIEWRSHPYCNLIYATDRDVTDRLNYEDRTKEISIRDPLNEYSKQEIFLRKT